MSVSARSFKTAAVGVAAALGGVFAIATSAQALEAGQCLSSSDMRTALRAEGQEILVMGAKNNAYGNVNIFTASRDGSKGYNIEGDTSLGTPSKESCVRAVYKNVVLYNNEGISAIPQKALFKDTDRATAIEICKTRGGGCRFHDDFMRDAYRHNENLVLAADLVVGDSTSMKFYLNATSTGRKNGQVSVTNSAVGVNEIRFGIKDVGYTQEGVDFLAKQGKQQQLAANQPN